ncbi:glycosyltransferase family 2 protein [Methylobacter psychrophilus]|uniref:glycosyltransferase family 2 protein n=1 Tax=Methylobacter psychrophilus TaxID=96941 RepID=UPI002948BC44|nr:glycosyltransferase family A protein [Methylobacter psychrophilus]
MNISVVIPTYNRCELLRRALLSVLSQTLLPTEITVIDDGSTDDTSVMIGKEFPAVNYYYQENCGVSSARNLGVHHATTDWIAFLDSDDEWLPEKLSRQTIALSANPASKICHTEEQWIRNGTRVNPPKKYAKKGGWIFAECLPHCAISPSTTLIHRSIFEDVGLFDITLPACEDYDLWLRITANYPVLLIEEPQIKKYGGHEDQLSQKFWGMDRFRINALEKILATSQLSSDNRYATIDMLLKKAEIHLNGVKKREKKEDINYYQQLIKRYQEAVREQE